MRWLVPFLFACTGAPGGDTAPVDSAADTDTDTDTDTDPGTGSISGTVVLYDGTVPADFPVQVCSLQCRYANTDATGAFSVSGLPGAAYKIDAVGADQDGENLGNMVVGYTLAPAETYVIAAPMLVPHVDGPVASNKAAGTATYTVGQVSLTFAATDLTLPFGVADSDTGDFDLYAGVIEGTNLAPLTSLWTVTPSFAVVLLPWITEPDAPMDIGVTGLASPDGSYAVYSLGEYGELEGPLGTASVSAGTATATGIQPSAWTWLLFVPA